MKRIFLSAVIVLGAIALQAQADAISRFFNQYVEDERFTTVFISPKMFEMIGKMNIKTDDPEADAALRMISKLKGLRILTTDVNPAQFYKEAKSKISTREYEPLMTVREKNGDNVEFLIKESGNTISELLLMVGGGDEFVLLSFIGDINLDDISKLSKSLDMKGTEHLDKLDDRNKNKNEEDEEEREPRP